MALLTPMEQSPCPACAWLNVQFLIWANKMYIFVLSQWNLNLENIYINIQQNVCKTKLSMFTVLSTGLNSLTVNWGFLGGFRS